MLVVHDHIYLIYIYILLWIAVLSWCNVEILLLWYITQRLCKRLTPRHETDSCGCQLAYTLNNFVGQHILSACLSRLGQSHVHHPVPTQASELCVVWDYIPGSSQRAATCTLRLRLGGCLFFGQSRLWEIALMSRRWAALLVLSDLFGTNTSRSSISN